MSRTLALVMVMAAFVAGCRTDVLIGGRQDAGVAMMIDAGVAPMDAAIPMDVVVPTDAPRPDARALTPFPDGTWTLTISATQTMALCTGPTVMGMEPAFASVTRDSLGFDEGAVMTVGVDATHIDVSGTPIATGFGTEPVQLEKGGGGMAPPDVWIGIGSHIPEPGPAGMDLVSIALEAHELTITPSGFDGRASALYVRLASPDDQCVVGFDAHFGR